ncbi:MAG: molybdate ABC transporter substrate-binding protein [Endomicrobium sp.]|jgi:molybdate transport system substrate-binding protein|nr:molybdate ABC transporter substrate-binding protein [Endomicrobium sp.]
MKNRILRAIFIALFALCQISYAADKNTATVFAAASMQTALDDIISQFKKENPDYEIRSNYDSSGTLATQITAAGGADIFISASKKAMDKVSDFLAANSRYDLLENKLVAIMPANKQSPPLTGADEATNTKLLMAWIVTGKMLSIGNYAGDSPVPAGEYAYNLLNSYDANFFNVLTKQGKLSLAQNVTAVLTQVATGAADIGFVYSTDAATRPNDVKIILSLTPLTKIIYPAAVLKDGANKPAVKSFFEYLKSQKAKDTLTKYGFSVL